MAKKIMAKKTMTRNLKQVSLALLLFTFTTSLFAASNGNDDTEKESPYFIVKTDGIETTTATLPLIHTEAEVNIAGVIADVEIKQIYVNTGSSPIEALYVFPGSSKSAVYGMEMRIGERTVVAEIQEKQKAQKMYEQAKSEGKSTSLLEQHRPNVFQMSVANIMPGDTIEVTLNYNELLVPQEGIYEFVYPTVVGPRYENGEGEVKKDWTGNPHTNPDTYEQAAASHTFDINVHLESGLNIAAATCTSHDININYPSASIADIRLKNGKGYEGTKDFIVQYKLAGEQIESGLLLYEGEKENFFLMMMQPPERVIPEQIPPREYIFIVDVSGSMNGFPIDISKKLMEDLFSSLRPEDRFNVLLFAGGSDLLSKESLPATKENISKALRVINNNNGSGGTEVLPALKRALNLNTPEGFSRNIVIATDGLVTVEKEAFELIRNSLGEANFFPFGIGKRNNRFMIEGMAHAAQTEPIMVTNKSEALYAAKKFQQFISAPVLTDIKIDYKGFKIYDVEPLSTPDIFAEKPVIVFGKYKGKPQGNITVNGVTGQSPYENTINVNDYKVTEANSALRYLWARQKILMLSDYEKLDRREDKKIVKEITKLGLDYNLLTDYTSFIAIDSETRAKEDERAAGLEDALAMNDNKNVNFTSGNSGSTGHSSSGGGNSGAAPEPHEWALIVLLMIMTSYMMLRRKL